MRHCMKTTMVMIVDRITDSLVKCEIKSLPSYDVHFGSATTSHPNLSHRPEVLKLGQ